jgi:hypothetical protein
MTTSSLSREGTFDLEHEIHGEIHSESKQRPRPERQDAFILILQYEHLFDIRYSMYDTVRKTSSTTNEAAEMKSLSFR